MTNKLKLIWNIDKFRLVYHGIEIAVSHSKLVPFAVGAIVEEQDTDRVLGEFTVMNDPGDKPGWYLANKLESEPQKKTGSVAIQGQYPVTLQAIVHDLNEDPSWRGEWIEQALDNIFRLTNEKKITAIQIPALGNVRGHYGLQEFIVSFIERLDTFIANETLHLDPVRSKHIEAQGSVNIPLNKIWLLADVDHCKKLFSILEETISAL